MRKIILIVLMLFFALPIHATNYYMSQSGSGNGSSCANSKAYNWDMSGVVGDDTVWLCGTFTSQPGISKHGTAGHPITVKWCTDADCGAGNVAKISFAAPAVAQFSVYSGEYIVLDGNGTDPSIECTDNGSSKGNKVDTGSAILVNVSNNIEIKNLTIKDLYVHDYGVEDSNSPETRAIYVIDSHTVKIHHITVTNTGRGILIYNNGGVNPSNNEIYNNTISKACWGMGLGTAASAGNYINGTKIYNNDIEMGAVWMGLSGCHLNGFYAWSNTPGSGYGLQNTQFYSNYFHGPLADPGGQWQSTAMLGADGYREDTGDRVFNNLFVVGPYVDAYGPTNGVIGLSGNGTQIYNNTLIGYNNVAVGIAFNLTTPTMKNNIITGFARGVYAAGTLGSVTADNNLYYNNTTNIYYGGSNRTLAQWQKLLGGCPGTNRDCNSITANPDLNSDYTEKATSPTKDKGTSLSNIFNTDKAGVKRPRGSGWDIGAYEYDK